MIRRTNRRMFVCLCLICLNLTFIWGNSLLHGPASAALSQWFHDFLNSLVSLEFTQPEQGHGLLRKLAHFSEFMLLGINLSWLLAMLTDNRKYRISLAVFFGWIAACTDETIQRFVPGRNGNLTDISIDTAGVIVGIITFYAGYCIVQNKKS